MKKKSPWPRAAALLLLSLCLGAFAACAAPAPAPATPPSALLTLDRLHGPNALAGRSYGPARWLADGTGYTTLDGPLGEDAVREVVRHDPASGTREVLVSAAQLTPAGADRPLAIADCAWSADGRRLLVFTNTRRVWRVHSRGDYWVLDLDAGTLRRLGAGFPEASLMFAKFSPDGTRVAYVQANDIWVEDLAGGVVVRLTHDGSDTIINGNFDWVYEEEFLIRDGFRWSPDGRRIAYWQLDAAGVGVFTLVDYTAALYPKLTPIPYPKAGTTNSACRIGIVEAAGGETTWLALGGDPRNEYVARMDWAASADEVVLQHLNRAQNALQVRLGNAVSGEVRTILTEASDTWVDVVDDLRWLEGGARFLWLSERDGWRHAYLVGRDGGEVRLLTPGPYDVERILGADEEDGWLYFTASPDDPTRRTLHRVPLDGSGSLERLTPADRPGTHSYKLSPDADWAIHTRSAFDSPPVIDLVRLPGHEVVRTLEDNAALAAAVGKLARGEREFFRVDIGGDVLLDAWSMKPPDFDPARRYPVLFYVYGEPWGQTVLDEWDGGTYLWHLLLTQRGYVVMSVDNRGTPAPRGAEWRHSIYGRIGILASADQAAAVRAIAARWPWVDRDRIGIWGWSGGGTMTLNALLRFPALYRTGLAVAPVPNERLYDTIYQERYMGLPDANPEGYRLGSPVTFADRLAGNLLLVHGTGDDNCHYQGTEELIDAFIAAGKRFTMMAYPNRSHGIQEGPGTRRHLYDLLTWYLEENLPPGSRPR
ncbi:MAG: S9 family peptidase [Planctomycetota bacterium]